MLFIVLLINLDSPTSVENALCLKKNAVPPCHIHLFVGITVFLLLPPVTYPGWWKGSKALRQSSRVCFCCKYIDLQPHSHLKPILGGIALFRLSTTWSSGIFGNCPPGQASLSVHITVVCAGACSIAVCLFYQEQFLTFLIECASNILLPCTGHADHVGLEGRVSTPWL